MGVEWTHPDRGPPSRVTDATKEGILGSIAQALALGCGIEGAFKNNNSKRLSHVSEPEAFAKQNLIPQHLHNSTFTGTPYSERWAYHDCVLKRVHKSRLLSFLSSREIGADLHLHNRKYLFGFSDFEGKADGDKGGAREDQRNPGNVVSVAGIKRDLLVASCQLCNRILRCRAMAVLDCIYFITTGLYISMLTDRTT